jgi:hypothetical protein
MIQKKQLELVKKKIIELMFVYDSATQV